MLMYCLTHRSYKLFCVRFIQKRFHLSNEKYSLDEAFSTASPLKYSRSDLRRVAGVPEDLGVGHPEIVGLLDT